MGKYLNFALLFLYITFQVIAQDISDLEYNDNDGPVENQPQMPDPQPMEPSNSIGGSGWYFPETGESVPKDTVDSWNLLDVPNGPEQNGDGIQQPIMPQPSLDSQPMPEYIDGLPITGQYWPPQPIPDQYPYYGESMGENGGFSLPPGSINNMMPPQYPGTGPGLPPRTSDYLPGYSPGMYDYGYDLRYDDQPPCDGGDYSYDQSPCNYPPRPPKIVCDNKTCQEKCIEHMGLQTGECFDGKCYCKEKKPWSYDDQEDWQGHCKDTVGQSPIEIEGSDLGAGNHPSVTDIELINYDMNVSIIVENTGYGLRLYVQNSILPLIVVSNIQNRTLHTLIETGNYALGHIDLHWNTSEHRLSSEDGEPTVMEAQLHHFDLRYDTYQQAREAGTGATLVLAVLFKLSEDSALHDDILDAVPKVRDVPSVAGTMIGRGPYLESIAKDLFQVPPQAYKGSDTTPPCSPGLMWLVAKDVLPVKSEQIEILQTVKDADGEAIQNNARHLKDHDHPPSAN